MPVRSLAGRISKLTLNDASLQFNIDDEADPFSVSIAERNYNAFASAIFIASANNFKVTLKSGTDGRSLSVLTVDT